MLVLRVSGLGVGFKVAVEVEKRRERRRRRGNMVRFLNGQDSGGFRLGM